MTGLYQTWVEAEQAEQRAYEAQKKARTNTNRVRYEQGYFATKRVREEAEGERGPRKATMAGDRVYWHTTLNGKRGNWLIRQDGSASLYHQNGQVEHYSSAGELITNP